MTHQYTASQVLDISQSCTKAMRERTAEELALGYVRYEALRKCHPHGFTLLCKENIEQGTPFDYLVDTKLVTQTQ